ncbi:sensor histidine kinase [Xylanimonas cellulosilytica]|uniref:sensor histidine kinase n=1 Tax=Xylanimonas cellulosilytica TaxID=186189 RepID=UPI00019C0BB0|nr:histidine kinase [Xylanimonas cellulosilytica]
MSTFPPALGVPAPRARTRRVPRLDAPGAPMLTRAGYLWGETWRILLAFAFGAAVFALTALEVESGRAEVRFELLPLLDLLLGLASLALLPLRRRAPLTIALLLVGFSLVAGLPSGAAIIASISLATRRRIHEIAILAVVFVPNVLAYDWFYPPNTPLLATTAGTAHMPDWIVEVGTGVIGYTVVVSIGAFIGARRDLIRSLHERAAASELEQARQAEQARAAERERIAREMHDVLAHRMSLVAMHAGALAYRIDLSPDQVRETATIIRDGTHQALEELRGVLGVLRSADTTPDDDGPEGAEARPPRPARPERPQPTLDDLDELVAQARSAGNPVRLVVDLAQGEAPPAGVSRHAYRLLQEALTNVRKHAPGGRVVVEVRGGPGDGLRLRTANPVSTVVPRASGTAVSGTPGAGMGLAGMTERAAVAGGTLTFGETDGVFEVQAWIPWPP